MRCIEILECGRYTIFVAPININMRCIEIRNLIL